MGSAPTVTGVVIGNEILTGKVQDLNAHFLARWLRQQGADLRRLQVVPDEIPVIAAAVAEESCRSDRVVTSGGIGPTHDDVTYRGVAAAFGLAVRRDEALVARLRQRYGDRVNDVTLRMADLPHPCTLHAVEGLWVPLVQVRNVFVLPGIPAVFQRMLPALAASFAGVPVALHSVYTRQREDEIAPALEAVLQRWPAVEIGSYPTLDPAADHRVRVTVESRDQAACAGATNALVERLDPARLVRVER